MRGPVKAGTKVKVVKLTDDNYTIKSGVQVGWVGVVQDTSKVPFVVFENGQKVIMHVLELAKFKK